MDANSAHQDLLAGQQKALDDATNDAIRRMEEDDAEHERQETEFRRKAIEALLSSPDVCSDLTDMESTVAKGVFAGSSYRDIAAKLSTSKSGVERAFRVATAKMRARLLARDGSTPSGMSDEQWTEIMEHTGFGCLSNEKWERYIARDTYNEAFGQCEDEDG